MSKNLANEISDALNNHGHAFKNWVSFDALTYSGVFESENGKFHISADYAKDAHTIQVRGKTLYIVMK